MSRRTLLTAGIVVAAAGGAAAIGRATSTLDDVLRALGAQPHPEPDPGDMERVSRAARDQAVIVATLSAVAEQHRDASAQVKPLITLANDQLDAVGGSTANTDVAAPEGDRGTALTAVARLAARSARAREQDAVTAESPEVARLLASMAGGLAQLARTLRLAA
ncbi:hypothetical protein [Aeromicrobium terrae]|uniref:hypothetical protein n=1 Tax=Aeromicrobium terrae TaxID=2498846 RepID=UPI00164FE8C5|nr:hypothetical protein [Aeromicrobium terrae]